MAIKHRSRPKHHRLLRRRARGFTLLELAIVVSIIAVLGGVLLNRIVFYMEKAEETAAQQVVGTLRSALHLKVAQLLVANRNGELAKLADENPMSWLAELPRNYAGEYASPDGKAIAAGNWYFDKTSRKLVYLPDYGKAAGAAKPVPMKFKVMVILPSGGALPGPPAKPEGVAIIQIDG